MTNINQPGDIGSSQVPDDVRANRRLRASVLYTAVIRLGGNDPAASSGGVFMGAVASDLKGLIRAGDAPSYSKYVELHEAVVAYEQTGAARDSLCRALVVFADNENASLDLLANVDVLIASMVGSAVRASFEPGDLSDGLLDSDELIRGLAACVTLEDAKQYLDQEKMKSTPQTEDFRQWLSLWQLYVEALISDPALAPTRFPVDAPWKGAVDRFYS
ncbi:hypothetical protein [Pinirhizobacter soli]|uniref:hypothetical protein n=1 Tax=Pinirhizobacter soli TaxID=2786953 RepID=UPI00202A4F10|nr:hypothetical protein [Pinirhizobacter soli]